MKPRRAFLGLGCGCISLRTPAEQRLVLESMAITWVCLYDVLVHLSLPKPKGNEHGREEACGAVAGRGADPFFWGRVMFPPACLGHGWPRPWER